MGNPFDLGGTVTDWPNGSERFNMAGSGAVNFAAMTINQNFNGSGNALITFGGNRFLVVGCANQIDATEPLF